MKTREQIEAAAIDAAGNVVASKGGAYHFISDDDLRDFIAAYEAALWQPITDLPEDVDEEYMIVTLDGAVYSGAVRCADYQGPGFWAEEYQIPETNVTYFRYLPTPPAKL